MPSEVETLIEELSDKLGEDTQAAVLLATLTASWAELAARLTLAEEAAQVAAGIAATSVQKIGVSMTQFKDLVEANDAALAQLHGKLTDTLSGASQHAGSAQDAMKNVLSVYSQFEGNVQQLKGSVASMTKSILGTTAPGLAALLGPKVDSLLGLVEAEERPV